MRDFTLDTKNPVLCCLNGNTAKMTFEQRALTETINRARKKVQDALEKRNFDVPNVKVVFYHIIEDEGKHVIRIASIACNHPDVYLGSDYIVRVRGFEMGLHEDGSGSLEVYCGDCWDKDRKEFLNTKRFHRKMDNQSRIVLQYDKHSWDSNTFRATDDCNRGYLPTGSESEPMHYTLQHAERVIAGGIEELLQYIESFPEQTIDRNLFAEPAPTPVMNDSFMKNAKLHVRINRDIIERLKDKKEKGNLGMEGGWRMLPLSVHGPKEHPHESLMNEGFVYCEIEMPGQPVTKNNWHYERMDDTHPATVKLASTNNVFVVDAHAADEFRNKWFDEHPGIDTMTNAAHNEMQVARAVTMVHINEYRGNYKKPIVVIGRTLAKKEIVPVRNKILDII